MLGVNAPVAGLMIKPLLALYVPPVVPTKVGNCGVSSTQNTVLL